MCHTSEVSTGELGIQRLLVQRLQRQVEAITKERDELVATLHRLANEILARVYVLEEERDQARVQRNEAEKKIKRLEGQLLITRKRIDQLLRKVP